MTNAMGKKNELKVSCATHKEILIFKEDDSLCCKELSLKLKDFPPEEDLWFFCCLCSVSSLGLKVIAGNEECPNCKKNIKVRFLCEYCLTLIGDDPASKSKKHYFITEDNVLNNSICKVCCKKNENSDVSEHNCSILKLAFFTSSEVCPFCEEYLGEIPAVKINRQIESLQNQFEEFRKTSEGSVEELKREISEIKKLEKTAAEALENLNRDPASQTPDFNEEISNLSNDFQDTKKQFLEYKEKAEKEFKNIDFVLEKNARDSLEKLDDFAEQLVLLQNKIQLLEVSKTPDNKEFHLDKVSTLSNKTRITIVEEDVKDFDEEKTRIVVNPTGLVSDIRKRFTDMEELAHYFGVDKALKPVNSASETVVFYRLESSGHHYAVPASNSVHNENQFKQFSGIYEARTTRLNGKIKIVKAAEIVWDEKIMGYTCFTKGVIDIV